MNLVTGYKDIHKSVGRDEPRPCARAPAPLARLRLARSAPRARVSAGKWALRAHFPAPKQITSVKWMNQKGMSLKMVNGKNY